MRARMWLALLAAVVLALGCDTRGAAIERGVDEPPTGDDPVTGDNPRSGSQTPDDPNPAIQDPPVYSETLAALVSVDDCQQLEEEVRAAAIRDMEERVDQNLALALEWLEWGGYCLMGVDDDYNGGGLPPAPTSEGASEYSTTNTQVQGVDEADFVKNDGSTIYILADGRFQIVDAWPPEQSHVVSSFPVAGEPKRMFVHAGRAVIYSSLDPLPQPQTDPWGYWYYYGDGECTYGYDCDFRGDGRALKITILDISDLTAPALLREMEMSGSYINSRRIGEAIHTVVHFPGAVFEGVQYWPVDIMYSCYDAQYTEEELTAMFEALKDANREIIEAAELGDFLPSMRDTRYVDGEPVVDEGLFTGCGGFYTGQETVGETFLSLLSIRADGFGAVHPTTVIGKPGAVYASHDALYVANRQQQTMGWGWYWDGDDVPQEASTIHKFALRSNPPQSVYRGSGVVKGRVLNQFAMDEYEGYLRIATTTGHVPDPNVHSTVSVLGEHGGDLVVVGQVDDIAPTEDIRSARFSGEAGFIVTFKKTDPLFVLDLSEPSSPAITGELHIPGFSTYMHLMDADHILAMGYDAEDHGDFAYFQGILLQIFDVSDMTDPRLTYREVIGTRGSTSDAATNHLAFNYFPARDLLAIPMTICEDSGGGGSYGQLMTFSGLMVYEVTTAAGFDYLGGVAHSAPETPDSYWNACSNWWTRSNSLVKRSVFMDDYVFSITEREIRVQLVPQLGSDLAVVDLTE